MEHHVGIDVSKDRLDVAIRPSGEAFVVARNATGLEELGQRLASLAPYLVALEATGGGRVTGTETGDDAAGGSGGGSDGQ